MVYCEEKGFVSSAIKSRLDLLDLATNGHLSMMTKAKMKKFRPPNLNMSAPSALTRMHPVGTGELWQPWAECRSRWKKGARWWRGTRWCILLFLYVGTLEGRAALCFYVVWICTYFQIQFAISRQKLGQSKSNLVPSTSTLSPPSLVSKSSSPAARKFPIHVSFVPQQLPTHTTLSVSSLDSQFSTFQSKVRKQNSWCTSSVSD